MKYIKDLQALEDFCKEIKQDRFITFDTEFIREKTYKPELCLIQIAGEKSSALIDVLEFFDLKPLIDILIDKKIMKVCHSGQQDLEIFYENYQIIPAPLADTQIMAMCNGYGENVAYHVLVSAICKTKLNKEMQLTNWKKRPLSEQQKKYAIADVTYLRDIYEVLLEKLKEKGRESWIEEEVSKLIDEDKYRFNIEDGWRKIKIKRHNPKQLSVVRALTFWREVEAYQQNKNRARILSDEAIYEISITQPQDKSQLFDLRKSNIRQVQKYTDQILNLVKQALKSPVSEMPKVPKKQIITEANQSLIDLLKLLLKLISGQYGVASKLIANAKEIENFVLFQNKDHATEFMKGWRYDIYGKLAQKIIEGELFLGYSDGKIIFRLNSSEI